MWAAFAAAQKPSGGRCGSSTGAAARIARDQPSQALALPGGGDHGAGRARLECWDSDSESESSDGLGAPPRNEVRNMCRGRTPTENERFAAVCKRVASQAVREARETRAARSKLRVINAV